MTQSPFTYIVWQNDAIKVNGDRLSVHHILPNLCVHMKKKCPTGLEGHEAEKMMTEKN